MKNIILTLATIAALTLFATPAAAEIDGTPLPTLRSHGEVEDNYIKLGDLFANLPEEKREIAVAYSPRPGRKAVFDALWLYRVARRYELKWRPMSRLDQAVISRPSQIIGQSDIERVLTHALADRGAPDRFQVEFSGRNLTMHITVESEASIEVEDLQYQPGDDRFTAILGVPGDHGADRRTRVSGRIYAVIDVPVLNRRMEAGDVISETDLDWLELRKDRIERDTVVDQSQLLGMTPQRAVHAGTVVRAGMIRRPILVEKNSLVSMHLSSGALRLIAQGRALENGSAGDVIRVQNTNSKNTIEATVTSHGTVAVSNLTGPLTN